MYLISCTTTVQYDHFKLEDVKESHGDGCKRRQRSLSPYDPSYTLAYYACPYQVSGFAIQYPFNQEYPSVQGYSYIQAASDTHQYPPASQGYPPTSDFETSQLLLINNKEGLIPLIEETSSVIVHDLDMKPLNNQEDLTPLVEEPSSVISYDFDLKPVFASNNEENLSPATEEPINSGKAEDLVENKSLILSHNQENSTHKSQVTKNPSSAIADFLHINHIPHTNNKEHSSTPVLKKPNSVITNVLNMKPMVLSNNKEHSVAIMEKPNSVIAQDKSNYSLPVMNTDLETQHQCLHCYKNNFSSNYDSVPPTLSQIPYDVFPTQEKTDAIKDSTVQPTKQLFHNRNSFYKDDLTALYREKLGYLEPLFVDLKGKELSSLKNHVNRNISGLSTTVNGSYDPFITHNNSTNCDIQKEILKRQSILEKYKETEGSIKFGRANIVITKVEEKCSDQGRKIFHKVQLDPHEQHLEKDCGKITSKLRKAISGENNDEIPDYNQQNQISKKEFNELKSLLQSIARNSSSKDKSLENAQDSESAKSLPSIDSYSCKCLNKLFKCLHAARDMGDFLVKNSCQILRDLGEVKVKER